MGILQAEAQEFGRIFTVQSFIYYAHYDDLAPFKFGKVLKGLQFQVERLGMAPQL